MCRGSNTSEAAHKTGTPDHLDSCSAVGVVDAMGQTGVCTRRGRTLRHGLPGAKRTILLQTQPAFQSLQSKHMRLMHSTSETPLEKDQLHTGMYCRSPWYWLILHKVHCCRWFVGVL